jgi:hypothetical protein
MEHLSLGGIGIAGGAATVTHREFVEWIRGAEAEFPVTSWTVRGIHAWPLIRLSLSATTFRSVSPGHSLGAGWRRLGINAGQGLARWARAYAGDRAANRRPWERADAVFLASSIGRRPLVGGRRYDIRSGPYVALLERSGARPLVWETSPYGDYNVPRHTPSFLVQPHLIALRAACQALPLGHDRVELEGYHRFLERVRDAGLRFPHADLERLRRDMLYLRRLADRFAGWLRRSRPRLGFVANTGLQEQAFCLACRELGITSVEVQHGVQGDLHPSYGSWFAVPAEGWETRARVFWSWDEESAAAINRWAACAPGQHVAIVGGDPWREMWVAERGEPSRSTDRVIEERKLASGAERHVLVTLSSQGDVVPAAIGAAVRGSPAQWRYWFRLHPVNQAERMREAKRVLGRLGVDLELMEFATEVPLHGLLRQVDCHLSAGLSTVVTEAAAHGVPSVACGAEAPDFYEAEAAAGMLRVAGTSEEILAALRRFMEEGRRPVIAAPARAPGVMSRLLVCDPTA